MPFSTSNLRSNPTVSNNLAAKMPPNHAVQLTPLARCVGWARFTRQNAPACWQIDNPQPPGARDTQTRSALQRSAARALPGSCLLPPSATLHTAASGAADSCPLGSAFEHATGY